MESKDLIREYLLGTLDAAEVEELERRLENNVELRQEFILAATIETGLREEAIERGGQPQVEMPNSNTRFRIAVVGLSMVATLLLAFLLWATFSQKAEIAPLVSSENAAWESQLPTTPGSELRSGRLKLKSGLATIRFHSGAEVVLEAPAELELLTPMRGKVHSGAAVVDVPDEAIGFVMETPEGYAVDYGTKFAVRVNRDEQLSDFEILEGEIVVHHPKTDEQVRLTGQGKAASVSPQTRGILSALVMPLGSRLPD